MSVYALQIHEITHTGWKNYRSPYGSAHTKANTSHTQGGTNNVESYSSLTHTINSLSAEPQMEILEAISVLLAG